MTTETIEVLNPIAAKDKSQPKTVSRIAICYDAAVARTYGRDVASNPSRCGAAGRQKGVPTYGSFSPHVRRIEPVMRSSYGVYQYFGRMLATGTEKRVRLIDANTPRLPTGDTVILSIKRNGIDCFASASHPSGQYCVPAVGANNTKEIFFLLNTLVYLSTTRSSLPSTPTVQLAP